jgi:hypothetical protein
MLTNPFNSLDQEITGDILLELNVDSLKELDVTTFGKRFKIYNAIKVLSDENVTRKEAPDTSDNNSINRHPSSPVSSSAHSIMSTSSNRQLPPPHIPYTDDDLVSDYSTVIRNSVTAPLAPSNQPTATSIDRTYAPTPSSSSSPPMIPADSRRMLSLDSARPLNIPPPQPVTNVSTSRTTPTQKHPAGNDGNRGNGDFRVSIDNNHNHQISHIYIINVIYLAGVITSPV